MPDTTPFHYAFRLRLHDTDAAGRLFFGHLFRHTQDALEAFMEHIDYPLDALIRDGELLLPLTHAEADYRRPMRHGEHIRVQVTVAELRRRSFAMGYRFLNAADEALATACTVHVLVSNATSSSDAALPEALRTALARQLADAL